MEKIAFTLPSEAELNLVSKEKVKEKPENAERSNSKMLFPVKSAFPETYCLFEACETFGSSTAVNEYAFSALTRIDSMKRMSICQLSVFTTYLLWLLKKNRLSSVKVEDIIRKFSKKNRKIRLF